MFDLRSAHLAQYHWGTLLCRFTPDAPVDKRTFTNLMATATAAGYATWKTDREFRTTVAVLHELCHLCQDLASGLGHADFHERWTKSPTRLGSLRAASFFSSTPFRPPVSADFAATVEGDSYRWYRPWEAEPDDRKEKFRKRISDALDQPIDDEQLFTFATECLLESDAALTTFQQLIDLRMTEEQKQILDANRPLIQIDLLDDVYHRPTSQLLRIVNHHMLPSPEQLAAIYPLLFSLMMESALAVPPLDWIRSQNREPEDFDPGVKFVRLLSAFQKLSGDAMDEFLVEFAQWRWERAEQLLLAKAPYSYPTARTVYELWEQTLSALAGESRVAGVRLDMCRYLLKNNVFLGQRGIGALTMMEAPTFFLHQDVGVFITDWGLRAFDQEQGARLIIEIVDRYMIAELEDFILHTGEFRCPLAQADLCPAAEDGCLSGYTNPVQFPASASCGARVLCNRLDIPTSTA